MENNEVIFDKSLLSNIDMQFLEMGREQVRIGQIRDNLIERVQPVVNAVNELISIAEISANVDFSSYINNVTNSTDNIIASMNYQIDKFSMLNKMTIEELLGLGELLNDFINEDGYAIQVRDDPNSEIKDSSFNELLRGYIDGQQNGTSNEQETTSTPETEVNGTPNVQGTASTPETQVNDEENTEETETETVTDWILALMNANGDMNYFINEYSDGNGCWTLNGFKSEEYKNASDASIAIEEEILAKANTALIETENEYGVNSSEAIQARLDYKSVEAFVNLSSASRIRKNCGRVLLETKNSEDYKIAKRAYEIADKDYSDAFGAAEGYMKRLFDKDGDGNELESFYSIFKIAASNQPEIKEVAQGSGNNTNVPMTQ